MIALLSMPLLLVLFSLGRAWLSEQGGLAATGCDGCLVVSTVQQDLALLAAFLVATALWLGLPRYVGWLAWLIQGGLLLIIIADLVTLAAFSMRLSWRDVLKFGGEWEAIQGYLGTKATAPTTGILWLIGFGILLSSWVGHLVAAGWPPGNNHSRRRLFLPLRFTHGGLPSPALALSQCGDGDHRVLVLVS